MIKIKQHLKNSEKIDIYILLEELKDLFGDFYLTKDNLRLYIKENLELLFKLIKKGDKILIDKDGLAIVIGFADRNSRKYIKLLAKNEIVAEKLLKVINWHFEKIELYTKLKRNNPLLNSFYKNGFSFLHGRGKEILIKKNITFRENKNVIANTKYEVKSNNSR